MKIVIGLAAFSLALVGASFDTRPSVDPSVPECPRAEEASFVGADSCKKCHFKQFTGWKKTRMAKAFDTLKPGNAAEAKKKFNLDATKDYTKDAKCVPCHTTGYGKAGGYPEIVEGKTWTEEETKRASAMENVQCEACHGPGSLTNVYKKDNEQYAKAEILKRGMHAPDEETCKSCHNDKSPTIAKDAKFDYATAVKNAEQIHPHVPLKHKH